MRAYVRPNGSPEVDQLPALFFRSTDRGQTWVPLDPYRDPEPVATDQAYRRHLVVSPTFAQDQTVLIGSSYQNRYKDDEGGLCRVQVSTDGGVTWGAARELDVPSQCGPHQLWRTPGGLVISGRASLSYDLGQTWQPVSTPPGTKPTRFRASPNVTQDGTILTGLSRGGVLLFGPGTQPTRGRVVCTIPTAPEAATTFYTDPWYGDALGCPKEAPATVQFTETHSVSRGRPSRNVWVGTGLRLLYRLTTNETDAPVWSVNLDNVPLPTTPERTTTGIRQTFRGGTLFVIPGTEGQPTELEFLSGTLDGPYRVIEVTP